MDSKPELTNLQRSQIDEMVSMAGELLFETGSGNRWTRNVLKELAHCLGRLYGETIRTCRGYDGLKEEVTTTFMCGMALEPNFGREEVLRDSGAEAQEEKTPGQLLYEKKFGNPRQDGPAWSQIAAETHLIWERNAMNTEEPNALAAANRRAWEGTDSKEDWEDYSQEPCPKCTGTGNMSLLGEYEKCDAC